MAPQIPVISGLLEPLARPEADFQARVREVTKVELPPGPVSNAVRLARSIEAVAPAIPRPGGSPELRPEEFLKAPIEAFRRIEEILPPGMPRLTEMAPGAEKTKIKEAEKTPETERPTVGGVRLKLA